MGLGRSNAEAVEPRGPGSIGLGDATQPDLTVRRSRRDDVVRPNARELSSTMRASRRGPRASSRSSRGLASENGLAGQAVDAIGWKSRGRSSVAEHQLPKLSVEGSIPFARSNVFKHLYRYLVRCLRTKPKRFADGLQIPFLDGSPIWLLR
jgi:hypothetical protein